MPTTLRDIARRAAVSPSTVSRVLRDYPHVSEETRRAVWQAVTELGYPASRVRKESSVRTVLALLRSKESDSATNGMGGYLNGELERSIVLGAQSVLEPRDITVRVQRVSMEECDGHSFLTDHPPSAVLVIGGVVNRQLLHRLRCMGIPVVVAGAHVWPMHIDSVKADYLDGMAQAIAHLIDRGRRRIALVNGPDTTTSSGEKYRGYRLALAMAGLPYAPELVTVSDFDQEQAYRVTGELLDRVSDVDAIAFADDYMAMAGMRAIRDRGRRIPGDVAVVGYYNYQISLFTEPPLTTVDFGLERMGAVAGHRLWMLLNGADPEPWCVTLPTRLVVRETT